jgi:hypothetical protein
MTTITAPRTHTEAAPKTPETPTTGTSKRSHADGMAVASFILGLLGTLVLNVVLGPCALVLGTLALTRGTTRRGRALLGLTLGAADLIILAALITTDGTVSWNLTG